MIFQLNQDSLLRLQNILNKNNKKILFILFSLSIFFKILILKFYNLPYFFDVSAYIETIDYFFDKETAKLLHKTPSNQMMPLYPLIAYVADKTMGIQAFNIIISCLNAYFLSVLSIYIFNNILFRYLVLVVALFYPFNIFYSITGFSETVYFFLLLTMMLSFYKDKMYLGTLLGTLGILIKPIHFLCLFALIIIFNSFYFKKSFKKQLLIFLNCTLIFILLMSPWWSYSFKRYDKFILFNLAGSHSFFIGNNPVNKTGGGVIVDSWDTRMYPERFTKEHKDFDYNLLKGYPGFSYEAHIDKVNFAPGDEEAIKRHNSYIIYSTNYIIENPGDFFKLSIKKFVRFWRLWPFTQEYNKPFYIIISLLSFGPIMIFFVLYIFKLIRKFEIKTFPIFFTIAYFSAVHSILISSVRYRFPIENFVIILALYYLFMKIYKKYKLNIK